MPKILKKALITSLIVGFPMISSAATSTEPQTQTGPMVSEPTLPSTFDGDVRKIPKPTAPPRDLPIREIPKQSYPRTNQPVPGAIPMKPKPESSAPIEPTTRSLVTPIQNFEGISVFGVNPPDTNGDVGPNHYIQMTNSSFSSEVAIFSKTGALISQFTLANLWPGEGACANGFGDPIVLYDSLADRWLLSEFARTNTDNHLCIYISKTSDPVSGGWYNYDFVVPEFPDYPKYGVWPDAYYVSTNEESGPAVYALDRDKMLNGEAATFQRFVGPPLAGFPFQAYIPADIDGKNPPPDGTPGFFMRHRDDEVHNAGTNNLASDFLEVWEFRPDFTNSVNSTFTGPKNIPMSDFDSDVCGLSSFNCFPQPGTNVLLDPIREVIMWRLQYRNFGTRQTMVGNFVVDTNGQDHGGIRWFELRRTAAGNWILYQEGTHSPNLQHRWLGSIAMDGLGNIALGYSTSSSVLFPSIQYAGRLATDPLGVLTQGPYNIVRGTNSQTLSNRWGDYSAMSVDPVDDCTFWYTSEYVGDNGDWRTRIANFNFSRCKPPKFSCENVTEKCNGITPTLCGTPGDDSISGTAGNDVIVGLEGNDTIHGLGGNDLICGNKGGDSLFGDLGNDELDGGSGNQDSTDGGIGTDKCTTTESQINCEVN